MKQILMKHFLPTVITFKAALPGDVGLNFVLASGRDEHTNLIDSDKLIT
jgi:hypothetical protein